MHQRDLLNGLIQVVIPHKDVLQRMNLLRVYLTDMNTEEAMRELQNRMKGTKGNDEFLASMNR